MSEPKRRERGTGTAKEAPGKDPHGLSEAQHLEILYLMHLNRAFDTRVSTLYRQNRILGAAFSSLGQEGISVGSTYALEPRDVIGPMIRNSGSILAKGLEAGRFLANYMARRTGPTRGRDGNTHLGDLAHGIIAPVSMLGVLIPVCAGAALAFRIRGENRVALTWIGDGGSSMGDFHEGLNFSAVLRLPLILILENNQYAYSTPVSRQANVQDLAVRAKGYGIPGHTVDGNDVLEVYSATREAVRRARRGEGPSLIEAKTMRMRGHAEHDNFSYVPKELLEEWKRKDPILRFENHLRERGILSGSRDAEIRNRVASEIESALAFAENSPLPKPHEAAEGVYADNS